MPALPVGMADLRAPTRGAPTLQRPNAVRPCGIFGQIAYPSKDFTILGLPVAQNHLLFLQLPPA